MSDQVAQRRGFQRDGPPGNSAASDGRRRDRWNPGTPTAPPIQPLHARHDAAACGISSVAMRRACLAIAVIGTHSIVAVALVAPVLAADSPASASVAPMVSDSKARDCGRVRLQNPELTFRVFMKVRHATCRRGVKVVESSLFGQGAPPIDDWKCGKTSSVEGRCTKGRKRFSFAAERADIRPLWPGGPAAGGPHDSRPKLRHTNTRRALLAAPRKRRLDRSPLNGRGLVAARAPRGERGSHGLPDSRPCKSVGTGGGHYEAYRIEVRNLQMQERPSVAKRGRERRRCARPFRMRERVARRGPCAHRPHMRGRSPQASVSVVGLTSRYERAI